MNTRVVVGLKTAGWFVVFWGLTIFIWESFMPHEKPGTAIVIAAGVTLFMFWTVHTGRLRRWFRKI
jgi:hypothetical protein